MLSGAESPKQPDLFDQPKPTAINLPPEKPEEIAPAKENEAEVINRKESEPARVKAFISSNDKEIERIVVFYTDQTFKQYPPS